MSTEENDMSPCACRATLGGIAMQLDTIQTTVEGLKAYIEVAPAVSPEWAYRHRDAIGHIDTQITEIAQAVSEVESLAYNRYVAAMGSYVLNRARTASDATALSLRARAPSKSAEEAASTLRELR